MFLFFDPPFPSPPLRLAATAVGPEGIIDTQGVFPCNAVKRRCCNAAVDETETRSDRGTSCSKQFPRWVNVPVSVRNMTLLRAVNPDHRRLLVEGMLNVFIGFPAVLVRIDVLLPTRATIDTPTFLAETFSGRSRAP